MLRVIEGGYQPGEPPPIVWNRLPIDKARVALVIRDARAGGYDLAWDDGRDCLTGIRSVRAEQSGVILSWQSLALSEGVRLRDERKVLGLANGSTTTAEDLRRLEQARAAKRAPLELPAGSLFDTVTRDQQEMF